MKLLSQLVQINCTVEPILSGGWVNESGRDSLVLTLFNCFHFSEKWSYWAETILHLTIHSLFCYTCWIFFDVIITTLLVSGQTVTLWFGYFYWNYKFINFVNFSMIWMDTSVTLLQLINNWLDNMGTTQNIFFTLELAARSKWRRVTKRMYFFSCPWNFGKESASTASTITTSCCSYVCSTTPRRHLWIRGRDDYVTHNFAYDTLCLNSFQRNKEVCTVLIYWRKN